MKIKIDKDGILFIERAGKLKVQECRRGGAHIRVCDDHTAVLQYGSCNDSCSLFGEPEPFSFDPITGEPIDETIELDLCSKTLSINVEDFEDER